MPEAGGITGRDGSGRFKIGNPGGPGGSRPRAVTLRRAAEDAISEEHVQAMIRKATRMGLEGNLAAMRWVVERVCGRPSESAADTEPLSVSLPRLRTASDCNLALERLADAICMGTVDRDAAKILLEVINARLKAIEVHDLEERLAELEKAADTITG